MKRLMRLVRDRVNQLQRNLSSGGEEQFLNNQVNGLKMRIDSADYILMKEYESLVKALEKEEDPIERCRIMNGIVELEIVLEKRRIIAEYLELES